MGNDSDRDRGRILKAWKLASLVALAVMILRSSSISGVAADPLAAMQVIVTERGKEAPDFTLPDSEDKRMGLRDFRGKIVLLTFFTTW